MLLSLMLGVGWGFLTRLRPWGPGIALPMSATHIPSGLDPALSPIPCLAVGRCYCLHLARRNYAITSWGSKEQMGFKPQQHVCPLHAVLTHYPSILFSVLLSLLIPARYAGLVIQLNGRELSS